MILLCLHGFSPGTPFSSHSPKERVWWNVPCDRRATGPVTCPCSYLCPMCTKGVKWEILFWFKHLLQSISLFHWAFFETMWQIQCGVMKSNNNVDWRLIHSFPVGQWHQDIYNSEPKLQNTGLLHVVCVTWTHHENAFNQDTIATLPSNFWAVIV